MGFLLSFSRSCLIAANQPWKKLLLFLSDFYVRQIHTDTFRFGGPSNTRTHTFAVLFDLDDYAFRNSRLFVQTNNIILKQFLFSNIFFYFSIYLSVRSRCCVYYKTQNDLCVCRSIPSPSNKTCASVVECRWRWSLCVYSTDECYILCCVPCICV